MAAYGRNFFRFARLKSQSICKSLYFSSISNVIKIGQTNKDTQIKGWVTKIRKMKDIVFVDIDDGSSSKCLQVVFPKKYLPGLLSNGSSIEAAGMVTVNSNGQLELNARKINLIGSFDSPSFPFSPKQNHSHDYCRQYLPYRPKLPHFKSLLRVRHRSLLSIHDWFDSNGFVNIHTPILTSNDCEGAGEIFKVLPVSQTVIDEMKKKGQSDGDAFFGNPAFLSVSGQLHLEAISRSISKVYSISPTFRAENSKSRLHLSEFYMLESEESFVDSLEKILDTMEAFLKSIILNILNECKNDLEVICKFDSVDPIQHLARLEKLAEQEFVRISFKEASEVINSHKNSFKSTRCEIDGLTKEHEHFLVKHFGCPVFVIDWPKEMKPFYMKSFSNSPELVSAVDLLVPNVGELCGGSLREDDINSLEKKLADCNLLESMQWYLDLRRFGNVPTGGFGMGFERFLQLVTGLTNIKDTIPFPRWPHSLKM